MRKIIAVLLASALPLSAAELKLDVNGIQRAIAHGEQFKAAPKVKPKPPRLKGNAWLHYDYELILDTDFLVIARAAAEAKNMYLQLRQAQAEELRTGMLRVTAKIGSGLTPEFLRLVIRDGENIIHPKEIRDMGSESDSWYFGEALVPFRGVLLPIEFSGYERHDYKLYLFDLKPELWNKKVEFVAIIKNGDKEVRKYDLSKLP